MLLASEVYFNATNSSAACEVLYEDEEYFCRAMYEDNELVLWRDSGLPDVISDMIKEYITCYYEGSEFENISAEQQTEAPFMFVIRKVEA